MADDKKMINLRSLNDNDLQKFWQEKKALLASEKQNVASLEQKVATQMPVLSAGGINDINKIIWPFFFNTTYLELAPGQSLSRFISITQEAYFVWTKQVKSVFEKVDLGGGNFTWLYVDPLDTVNGIADDLEMTITDAQSSRTFHFNPISMNHVGHGSDPEVLISPMMIPSNSNLEVKFYNNHATKTYCPRITQFGYRVRVQDAHEILGLVRR